MKKILYVVIFASVLLNSVLGESTINVYNTSSGTVITDISYLKTYFVNQNPSTAVPGEYVDLLFKVENRGTYDAKNVTFEILPSYPFSLNPGVNAKQDLGTITGLQSGNNAFLVKYKLKVDEDAVDGDNEIKLKYSYSDGSYIQTYNVSVSNPRTDFDVIIQDSTGTSTTLAIANIGANTAYSTIIKIPQQENFRVSGASASIVGNLNAGDYTLVSFQINSISIANVSNSSRTQSTGSFTDIIGRNENITVEVSYTDTLGIRRVIQKQVPFDFANSTGTSSFQRSQSSTSLLGNNGITYIAIGVVGIIVIVAIFKLRKRKKK